jgi:hypothetical protein
VMRQAGNDAAGDADHGDGYYGREIG